MKKHIAMLLTTIMCLVCIWSIPAYAAEGNVTSYAFANIAGTVGDSDITVTVPYSTVTTYWNHKVAVSDGASFRTSTLTKVDEQHYTGTLTVVGSDGSTKDYTVHINKSDFKAPTYSLGKAHSIRKNGAKISVKLQYNDAKVRNARVMYYTKKNNLSSRSVNGEGDSEVEITGLASDTKYYYYLSIETDGKTYETSSKSFTTKKVTDTGTNNSSTNNPNKNTTPKKGTNANGPATTAKQNDTKKNQWVLDGSNWLYFGEDGFSKVGWFQVGDKWYYTTKGTNELAMSCWKKISDVWYFFDASGSMLSNNWVFSNNAWYWMGPSGSMLVSQEIDVNGKHYLLGPDGVCIDNKMVMKDGRWQYYKPGCQGLAVNENFTYNGGTYKTDGSGYIY